MTYKHRYHADRHAARAEDFTATLDGAADMAPTVATALATEAAAHASLAVFHELRANNTP